MPETFEHEDYVPAPAPTAGYVVIEFPDQGRRDAGLMAADLKLTLDNAAADADLKPVALVTKAYPNAQDLGTILTIALNAKAAVAIAGGLALWMRRRNQARIRVRYSDGTSIDISGLASQEAAKFAKKLFLAT